jgi:AMP-binding enzyme
MGAGTVADRFGAVRDDHNRFAHQGDVRPQSMGKLPSARVSPSSISLGGRRTGRLTGGSSTAWAGFEIRLRHGSARYEILVDNSAGAERGIAYAPLTTRSSPSDRCACGSPTTVRRIRCKFGSDDRDRRTSSFRAARISSIEVEDVLYRRPDILEAAVVARPDEKWGETPCARSSP